jgi:hypothetical protein
MWLLGQPWIVLAAGAAVLVVLFGILQQTGKRWALIALIVAAIAVAGLLALERLVITPEEAIKATLHRIADNAEREDVEAVVGHISRRAPELQNEIRIQLRPWALDEVRITDIKDLTVKADGQPPVASATVRARATVGPRVGGAFQPVVRDFRVDFVLEDGQWRIRGAEDLGIDLPGRR